MIVVGVPEYIAKRADVCAEIIAKNHCGKGHKHKNDPHKADWPTSLKRSITGMRGEAGLWCFLDGEKRGLEWDTSILRQTSGLPDFEHRGFFLDAKAVANRRYALQVYDPVQPDWIYVLVDCWDWTVCEMAGYAFGREIMEYPLENRYPGRPAHYIDRGDPCLKNCMRLIS